MAVVKQNTAYTRAFMMILAADHISGATGLTVALNISKAGAAFAAAGGAVSEIGNGWYKVSLNTTDTNTLGDLAYHATAIGADPTDFVDQVCANVLGDTLPASVAGNVGGNVVGSVGSVATPVTVGTNNDKTGYLLSTAGNQAAADALLDRDMSVGVDSGSPTVRTVRQALRLLRNKFTALTGTLTVYKEDDITASWTAAYTTNVNAQPIVTNDPAG